MNRFAFDTLAMRSALTVAALTIILFGPLTVRAEEITVEDDCKSLTDCMDPLFSFKSSMYPTPSYPVKTAVGLFRKGCYVESLPWFEKSTPERELWYNAKKGDPIEILCFPEYTLDWAIAYERVGKLQDALATLAHGNPGWCALPHIRLLLKLGKCEEAKTYCDIRQMQITDFGIPSTYRNERSKLKFLRMKAESGKPYKSKEPFSSPKPNKYTDSDRRKEISALTNDIVTSKRLSESEKAHQSMATTYHYRGKLYLETGQLERALADAKIASKANDITLMDIEAMTLLKLKRYDDCIKFIKAIPTTKMEQRDKTYWNLYLAKAYLLNRQFESASAKAAEVIESEREIDPMQFCKMSIGLCILDKMTAQAKLILAISDFETGKLERADAEAQQSENEFLSISRIDCRDLVRRWRINKRNQLL